MKTFLIRGVPMAMQQDGWWLNNAPPVKDAPRAKDQQDPGLWRAGVLVLLIMMGDVLVWQVVPGLSLAVFGAALVSAALWVGRARISKRRQVIAVAGGVVTLLPLVELVQPLSLLIAIAGVSGMLALLAGLQPDELWRGALRLWPMGVRQTFVDGAQLVQRPSGGDVPGMVTRWLMRWFMPLVLGLIFVALLLEANPIASRWVAAMTQVEMKVPDGARLAFWVCLAPLAWTALSLRQTSERLRAAPRAGKIGPRRQGLINSASVTRALVLFNAVFVLQSGTDVIYLYGGLGLPEGITHAEYAHRGAYPLVVTALLAGCFAMLSRRWVEGNDLLRGLLMLWVAQNVALVVSSLVRLELYVAVYGLTHLRLAAAIWMGMVAGGLALILVQVWRHHNTAWLLLRGGAMAGAVLYACAWISFDAAIARVNLSDSTERLDRRYLCRLGDGARPVVAAYNKRHGTRHCSPRFYDTQTPKDWREWGFRNWRARTSLAAIQAEVTP